MPEAVKENGADNNNRVLPTCDNKIIEELSLRDKYYQEDDAGYFVCKATGGGGVEDNNLWFMLIQLYCNITDKMGEWDH